MRLGPLVAGALVCVWAAGADDAVEIIRRSISVDQANWQQAKDYTYLRDIQTRELDAQGQVKALHSDTYDVVILYGRPYERLIERDGKPLSGKQAQKEQEQLDRTLVERRQESEDQNNRRRREYDEHRRKQREFLKELPDAFVFRLAGEDFVDGHTAWIIAFEPKPGYHPHDRVTGFLPKLRGRVWVDKAGAHWVKLEAETTGIISFGLFLARLDPGARISFEQKRVNREVWLPAHASFQVEARLALVKKTRATVDITYKQYRKFQSDSRVVSGGQAP